MKIRTLFAAVAVSASLSIVSVPASADTTVNEAVNQLSVQLVRLANARNYSELRSPLQNFKQYALANPGTSNTFYSNVLTQVIQRTPRPVRQQFIGAIRQNFQQVTSKEQRRQLISDFVIPLVGNEIDAQEAARLRQLLGPELARIVIFQVRRAVSPS